MQTFASTTKTDRSAGNKPARSAAELDAVLNHSVSTVSPLTIHRKAGCSCGGGCPSCQANSGNLKISQPNNPTEIEADQIADRVMRMAVDDANPKSDLSQTPNTIHRKCDACEIEEEEPGENQVMRKETFASTAPTPAPADAPQSIRNVISSGGQPLGHQTRSFFEPRFGRDLSQVRIHTNSAAAQSARSINARAYTLGNSIVFGSGQHKPDTEVGKHLLAHELSHIVQQVNTPPSEVRRSAVTGSSSSQGERPGGTVSGEAPSQGQSTRGRQSPSKDSDCPNYEPGEKSASNREPGLIEPDIERLAPDKLLIADFGVDGRHVKSSTKSDPTLIAWLSTWESDDSYQLSIVGYSDCVGNEGINTGLRQARASNVEALLGPAAKSRVTFRGMAALGSYVTSNDTAAKRARNRGVIIKFYQKFEFEEDPITVTPQYCGPDSAQWLVDQMNKNRDHPVIKMQREVEWPNYIPFFNLGWNYGALTDFRDLVKAGGPWDFKSNQKQWRSGPNKKCPTTKCDKTVRLCGTCFFYDVPGNIHYGYIGRMASLRSWFLHNRAAAAQKGGVDPPEDVTAIDIGIAMADKGATLCDEIAAHENELNKEGTEGCSKCPE